MGALKSSPPDAQLTLRGIEAAKPTDRLFFAIFPDSDTAAKISLLAQTLRHEHALRGKLLRPERLHVTLIRLSD